MLTVRITQGYDVLVDEVDADLSNIRWCVMKSPGGLRYARKTISSATTISGQTVLLMHRVILGRELGRVLLRHEFVDHINGNGLDNRRSNLRLSTQSQNMRNTGKYSTNTSGYKGVSWHKHKARWRAEIRPGKGLPRKHLGYYDDPAEAYEAYKEAAIEFHGEFARLD